MKIGKPKDRSGKIVSVGDRVRVLKITDKTLEPLPIAEQKRLKSMIGEVFVVYEIDKWGQPWVEKWWEDGVGLKSCHCLSLAADEMERVSDGASKAQRKPRGK